MRIDDPGRGRQQGADAIQRRLKVHGIGLFHPPDVVNTVCQRLQLQRLEARDLTFIGGDDQFAASPMADAMVPAIAVEPFASLNAEPRLKTVGRVIDAGVDNFRIARRRAGTDGAFGFEYHHLAPRLA